MYHTVQPTCLVTVSRPHGRGRAEGLVLETERIRRERTSCGRTPTRSHHDVGRCRASFVFAVDVWARPARRLGGAVDRWRDPVSRRHPAMRGCWGVAMTISYQQPAAERSVDVIYRAVASGAACWARSHRGHVRELPMARWIGGPATTPQDRLADEHVLAHCFRAPHPRPGLRSRAFHRGTAHPGIGRTGGGQLGCCGGVDAPSGRYRDPAGRVRSVACRGQLGAGPARRR